MNDHTAHERTKRSYTRKEVIRGAVGAGATLGLAPLIAACGGGSSLLSWQCYRRRHYHHR